ncbi:hypothetical protein RhiJN_09987 [Ceratobasidium sp. AG-Ba]|nr:hypothetical protein RhiJN_09987 [Ceratobasidium sp. AG-Ba]QRW10753.1 hypothetical protein RhiLY_09752 [Ceratobasidium sp. AG-Ba]
MAALVHTRTPRRNATAPAAHSAPALAPSPKLSATSSPTVKRRAASPAARPSPKRSRSEENADDSFLALLLPNDMSRFAPPTDSWAPPRDDDRVTLPPIAEDRRASLPVASSSGYVFTNTFESPRPSTAASSPAQQYINQARRPHMHTRTFSSPVLPGHPMQRTNAIGLQEDPLSFSPHSIPSGAMDWLGPGIPSRPVSRDESMSEFDPSAFGLDSGASSPAFAFGPSPFSGFNPQFHPRSQQPLNIAQALASSAHPSPMNSPAAVPIDPALGSMPPRDQLENELSTVRAKIRELEFLNDLLQLRVVELESDKNKAPEGAAKKQMPAEFEASWDARTDARVKRFCSLNRAGNALCAWHDSRRERRAYPPRMAPPGHLNCGCTYEEALFEESLARHGVGSYHPGENVRMDPALRNPLLKLLQWRFGYKDGDFERDPASGDWVEGEGEHAWESTARPSGNGSSRRQRSND